MPTQEEMDQLRAEAMSEIKRLTEDRNLWHARAFAMFWRLPDDTKIGDLHADAEKAMSLLYGQSRR